MASAIFALEKQSSFISATSKATRLTNKTAVSNQSDEEDKIEYVLDGGGDVYCVDSVC